MFLRPMYDNHYKQHMPWTLSTLVIGLNNILNFRFRLLFFLLNQLQIAKFYEYSE